MWLGLPFYETTTIWMVISLTSKNWEDLFNSEGQNYRSDRNPGIKTLHWGIVPLTPQT